MVDCVLNFNLTRFLAHCAAQGPAQRPAKRVLGLAQGPAIWDGGPTQGIWGKNKAKIKSESKPKGIENLQKGYEGQPEEL